MDQQEEKAGKTEPKGARSSRHRSIDSPHTHSIDPMRCPSIDSHQLPSSIDPMQEESLDRPSIDPMQRRARSIPFCLSRSINPGQMISQPFDLLGANRLRSNHSEPD
ncbi:unnamed protein product [Microthlaspi erraticum]|uniref:Uncharacterized protein n=1 Tax=Microthlaspi erraticum TaxID=1685480 RepID=A0A6D2IEY7_9BRAS|nr:unnamed protein product [Microthlaspi erraticum]